MFAPGMSGVSTARFKPTFIPGCIYWTPPEKMVQVANVITAWPDQSGAGNNPTPQNAPAYLAGVLDGYPGANLDGISMHFTLPNVFTGLTSGEMFIVPKLTVLTAGPYGLHNISNNVIENAYGFVDGHIYEGFGSTTRPDTGAAIISLTANYRLYNCRSANNAFSTYLNGTQQYTSAVNTVAFANAPKIGKTVAACFQGVIVEPLIYNRVLTTPERTAVYGYFRNKYPSMGL